MFWTYLYFYQTLLLLPVVLVLARLIDYATVPFALIL